MDGINSQTLTWTLTTERQSVQLTPDIEYYVQLDTLDIQQDEARLLTPPATGSLPLADSGPLGTRLNELA